MRLSGVTKGSFAISVDQGRVYVRVFNPHKSDRRSEDEYAESLAEELHTAVHLPWLSARSLILDVRGAPSIAGAKTRQILGEMLNNWEKVGRRVAIVVGDEPIKQVQFRTVVNSYAPMQGKIVLSMIDAEAWCGQAPQPAPIDMSLLDDT